MPPWGAVLKEVERSVSSVVLRAQGLIQIPPSRDARMSAQHRGRGELAVLQRERPGKKSDIEGPEVLQWLSEGELPGALWRDQMSVPKAPPVEGHHSSMAVPPHLHHHGVREDYHRGNVIPQGEQEGVHDQDPGVNGGHPEHLLEPRSPRKKLVPDLPADVFSGNQRTKQNTQVNPPADQLQRPPPGVRNHSPHPLLDFERGHQLRLLDVDGQARNMPEVTHQIQNGPDVAKGCRRDREVIRIRELLNAGHQIQPVEQGVEARDKKQRAERAALLDTPQDWNLQRGLFRQDWCDPDFMEKASDGSDEPLREPQALQCGDDEGVGDRVKGPFEVKQQNILLLLFLEA